MNPENSNINKQHLTEMSNTASKRRCILYCKRLVESIANNQTSLTENVSTREPLSLRKAHDIVANKTQQSSIRTYLVTHAPHPRGRPRSSSSSTIANILSYKIPVKAVQARVWLVVLPKVKDAPHVHDSGRDGVVSGGLDGHLGDGGYLDRRHKQLPEHRHLGNRLMFQKKLQWRPNRIERNLHFADLPHPVNEPGPQNYAAVWKLGQQLIFRSSLTCTRAFIIQLMCAITSWILWILWILCAIGSLLWVQCAIGSLLWKLFAIELVICILCTIELIIWILCAVELVIWILL